MNRRQFLQNALKAAAVVPVVGIAKVVGEQPAEISLLPDMELEYDYGLDGDIYIPNNIIWDDSESQTAWMRSEDDVTPIAVNVNGQQRWIAVYSE